MQIEIKIGDVLQQPADVLISTANPWLNMSGGVNGAIREQAGESIQLELREHLASTGRKSVSPGSVIRTSAGPLPFKHILHAVAIDPFHDSSVELVAQTLNCAFTIAQELESSSLSMPTLATGYGHLTMESFAKAFAITVARDWSPLHQIYLVVRSEQDAEIVRNAADLH
jgi:O-acetyl-ADP-ribose deacetylase (regulator of RNase III)